jgi:hypothetical protein
MLAGNVLALAVLFPIYRAMTAFIDPIRRVVLTLLVFAQMVPFAIVYAPLAAFLVEAFPARIRYTSISLPYNLGNGWFGGFLPLIATALVAATGDKLAWLWYPIAIAAITVVVGGLYVREPGGGIDQVALDAA